MLCTGQILIKTDQSALLFVIPKYIMFHPKDQNALYFNRVINSTKLYAYKHQCPYVEKVVDLLTTLVQCLCQKYHFEGTTKKIIMNFVELISLSDKFSVMIKSRKKLRHIGKYFSAMIMQLKIFQLKVCLSIRHHQFRILNQFN